MSKISLAEGGGLRGELLTACKLLNLRRAATDGHIAFYFSYGFHKEVTSSTGSAQGGECFLLRGATIYPRVGSSKTCEFLHWPDVCGRASGSLAILEGELPGDIPESAQAQAGCPGVAASSPIPLARAGDGPLATAVTADVRSSDLGRGIAISGQLWQMRRSSLSAVGPQASSRRPWRRKASQGIHEQMRLGWLARAAFLFLDDWWVFFERLVMDLFCRGFHRKANWFTTSAQPFAAHSPHRASESCLTFFKAGG